MDAWLQDNWTTVAFIAMATIKALNLVTRHFADYTGVRRWCVFLIDLLDIVKSSHGGLPGSRPPGSLPPDRRSP